MRTTPTISYTTCNLLEQKQSFEILLGAVNVEIRVRVVFTQSADRIAAVTTSTVKEKILIEKREKKEKKESQA